MKVYIVCEVDYGDNITAIVAVFTSREEAEKASLPFKKCYEIIEREVLS